MTPATRALVVIDPNNPTGATYPLNVRCELVELADRHNFALLADEVYADLAFDGPVRAIAEGYPDAPVITFSSLSKAYLAPGWRAGWMAVGRTPRLDPALAAIKKLADGRLCSPGPMQYAVTAALTGDRSHQDGFRRELRLRAELTTERLLQQPQRLRRDCLTPTARGAERAARVDVEGGERSGRAALDALLDHGSKTFQRKDLQEERRHDER